MSNFKNLESQDKPREKIKYFGISSLTDAELLSIILISGSKENSVTVLAQKLIEKYGGLKNVLMQPSEELESNHGIGVAKASKMKVINELMYRIENRATIKKKIRSSSDVYNLLSNFKDKAQEHFIVVNLDVNGNVINYESIYKGTVDQIQIHPREIFNYPLREKAHSIIICHNHPSGDYTPSIEDIESTEKLLKISKMIGVKIIDHIVISINGYHSMREKCDIIFK